MWNDMHRKVYHNRKFLYYIIILGVQKSSELFFVKFNLYSKTNEKKWLAA